MELNLKYYKGTDEYSDGDIEDKIIDFIKKYPDDYEKAFEEDCSWPVFYHLSSVRKNVISWYPFKKNASILEVGAGMGAITSELVRKCKKVTSMELSKRRATAILERNKNAKNLEIIVGNFNDIELKEKYDYILLNGVLEYAALYMNSSNPYVDFINKLKTNLKPDGKILIAIENRMGLKYWCGANEENAALPYLGINNYNIPTNIRTFDKFQLVNLFKKCDMKSNFYYMFPDYKFPDIIVTDEFLKRGNYFDYCPYYYEFMNLFVDEYSAFDSVRNNNAVAYMANSYFIELSFEKVKQEVEYVKYNNYRSSKYNLMNYICNNKFYKEAIEKNSIDHIKTIESIYKKFSNEDFLPLTFNKNTLSCDLVDFPLLKDIIDSYLKDGDYDSIVVELKKLFDYLKKISGSIINTNSKNVFDKYNVKVDKKILSRLHFYEDGLIDLIPSNIFIDNGKYIIIDQEWYEANCPIEYCYFRIIYNTFPFEEDRKRFLREFNIEQFRLIFLDLEKYFMASVTRKNIDVYSLYRGNSNLIGNYNNELKYYKDNCDIFQKNIDSLNSEISLLNDKITDLNMQLGVFKENNDSLKNQNNLISVQLNNIYSSKGYRLLNRFYKLKSKVRRNKK